MKVVKLILVLVTSGLLLTACTKATQPTNSASKNFELTPTKTNTQIKKQQTPPPQKGPIMKTLADFETIEASQATLLTNKGEIVIKLFRDKAPLTTANFLNLAKEKFYDGVVFHRVIDDFMAQVGDPKSKDPALKGQWDTGGPGYTIKDEFDSTLTHDKKGIVSMANSGPNTGGSQFFITYKATPWLDNKHAIFGEVVEGLDVLDQVVVGDTLTKVTYQ